VNTIEVTPPHCQRQQPNARPQQTPTSSQNGNRDHTQKQTHPKRPSKALLPFLQHRKGAHNKIVCLLCEGWRIPRGTIGYHCRTSKTHQLHNKTSYPHNHPIPLHASKLSHSFATSTLTIPNFRKLQSLLSPLQQLWQPSNIIQLPQPFKQSTIHSHPSPTPPQIQN
jgi:hypothetical protein